MSRAIDGDAVKRRARDIAEAWRDQGRGYEALLLESVVEQIVDTAPTLTPQNEWVSVEDRLPELPKEKYCWVCVLGCRKSSKRCMPMLYERTVVRGKTVERWRDMEDRITHELPDYWMPLPAPPVFRPPEGEV